jgi:predicted nucleic acid-binding protein
VIIGLDTSFVVQLEVAGHPGHERARMMRDSRLDAGDRFGLAPQVLAEFVHVVTDARRFEHPLSVEAALQRADAWWNADEVAPIYPNEHTITLFLGWLRDYRLGRKRLLDTLLAATYFTNEVTAIVTANARDYGVFASFEVLST